MSVPPSRDPVDHRTHTKPVDLFTELDHGVSLKTGAKPDDALTGTSPGGIRALSPSPSLLSIEDGGRLGLSSDAYRGPEDRRHASRSPARRAKTLKEKIRTSWTANLGLVLVLVSQFFGVLMNMTTRMLEIEGNDGKGYHPFQILFARMGITVICSSGYMWWAKTKDFPLGMKEVRYLLLARGFFGFFGVFGMYYSLLYLPLAEATVITFLAPSLACWACSFLINEPFTRMEQIAAYVSLSGVVLIARPTSFFHSKDALLPPGGSDTAPIPTNATADTTRHLASAYDNVTPAQRASAVGIAMLGVVGAAGAYTTIRWIGKRAHPLISVNYFAAWCTIVSVVMMCVLPDVGFLLPQSMLDFAYLIFLGLCGFIMQFLLAAGLQYEKSSRATNMVYVQMLFALAFDKLVFGTTPSALSIVGSSLILGSAIYVATHKSEPDGKKERGEAEEERGLMGDVHVDEGQRRGYDNDNEIQMRTLR